METDNGTLGKNILLTQFYEEGDRIEDGINRLNERIIFMNEEIRRAIRARNQMFEAYLSHSLKYENVIKLNELLHKYPLLRKEDSNRIDITVIELPDDPKLKKLFSSFLNHFHRDKIYAFPDKRCFYFAGRIKFTEEESTLLHNFGIRFPSIDEE